MSFEEFSRYVKQTQPQLLQGKSNSQQNQILTMLYLNS